MPMPSRLPAFAGAALVALGLALAAPSAHADDTATPAVTTTAPTTTATDTATTAAAEETTTTTTTTAPVTETTTTTSTTSTTSTTTSPTTTTSPVTETATATATVTATATATAPTNPVPTIAADECGMYADMVTIPDAEGVHYVAPSPDPKHLDDLELRPGTYPAAFIANDPSDFEGEFDEEVLTEYHVIIEARMESEGPAVATTRLTFTLAGCPSKGVTPVTAKAGPGTVTFTNPAGNPTADIAWGDPHSEDPDGFETAGPGESVTIETTRTRIAWIALDLSGIPTFPADPETATASMGPAAAAWAKRWSDSPLAAGAAPLRAKLSPRLHAPAGAVIVVDPTFVDPEELAELREIELAMVDFVLGAGELDVPQPVATTPTTTVTVTETAAATPTAGETALAYTGSSDARPLAGLSVGLVLAGLGLVLAASGRVRLRRH